MTPDLARGGPQSAASQTEQPYTGPILPPECQQCDYAAADTPCRRCYLIRRAQHRDLIQVLANLLDTIDPEAL